MTCANAAASSSPSVVRRERSARAWEATPGAVGPARGAACDHRHERGGHRSRGRRCRAATRRRARAPRARRGTPRGCPEAARGRPDREASPLPVTWRGVCAGARRRQVVARPRRRGARPRDRRREPGGRPRPARHALRAHRARRAPTGSSCAASTQPAGAGGSSRSSSPRRSSSYVVIRSPCLHDGGEGRFLPSPPRARCGDGRGSARSCSRSCPRGARARRRSSGSSRPGRRSGRGSPGTRRRAGRGPSRTVIASSSFAIASSAACSSTSSTGTTRPDARSRSRQQFRVSWPIHGRIASSERSESSRSKTRMKTFWNTSSASWAGQAERLGRDRRDVAGEPLDERVPRFRVAARGSRRRGLRRTAVALQRRRPRVRLAGLGGAKSLGERLEELPRELGPLLDERPEAPDREGVRHHRRRRRHRCRPGGLVDERDLAERGAGAECADGVSLHGDRCLAARRR